MADIREILPQEILTSCSAMGGGSEAQALRVGPIRRCIGIPAEMSAGLVPIYTEKGQEDRVFSIDSRILSDAATGVQL